MEYQYHEIGSCPASSDWFMEVTCYRTLQMPDAAMQAILNTEKRAVLKIYIMPKIMYDITIKLEKDLIIMNRFKQSTNRSLPTAELTCNSEPTRYQFKQYTQNQGRLEPMWENVLAISPTTTKFKQ